MDRETRESELTIDRLDTGIFCIQRRHDDTAELGERRECEEYVDLSPLIQHTTRRSKLTTHAPTAIRPSKSVSFSLSSSDDEPSTSPSSSSDVRTRPYTRSLSHPNLLTQSQSTSTPTDLTEPAPPLPAIPVQFSGSLGISDDASTDSGLASIPEGVAYDMSLEEGHGEVVAEAIAEDDAEAVRAFEVDGVLFTAENLEALMLGEEREKEERWMRGGG